MNGKNVHRAMFKMLTTTVAFSIGVGVSFGSVIVAIATVLQ